MPDLVAITPASGLLPVTIGDTVLAEADPVALTAILPFKGRRAEVAGALRAEHGVGFPSAGRSLTKGGVRITWMGPDQALLIGPPAGEIAGAALVDQSDGWARLHLAGPLAEAALARLVPVDLRASRFRRGHTARTALFHVPASITRVGVETFEILVFRSMTSTVVGELSQALRSVDAQKSQGLGSGF